MGKKKEGSGKTKVNFYQLQNRYARNKRRKLERHLKAFPGDKCATKALDKGDFTYKRKAPKSKVWSSSDKYIASLFAEAGRSGAEVLQLKKERLARPTKEDND